MDGQNNIWKFPGWPKCDLTHLASNQWWAWVSFLLSFLSPSLKNRIFGTPKFFHNYFLVLLRLLLWHISENKLTFQVNILYPDRLDNVEAIRCCVQIFESFHFSQINGFFKGEFFRLQDVTLFEKNGVHFEVFLQCKSWFYWFSWFVLSSGWQKSYEMGPFLREKSPFSLGAFGSQRSSGRTS